MARGLRGVERPVWYWRETQEEYREWWVHPEPEDPEDGEGWLDGETGTVRVWNGREWVFLPGD